MRARPHFVSFRGGCALRKETTRSLNQGSGLERQVLRGLENRDMLRPGDRVGVAVSGGADSMALLLLLLQLRKKLGIVLSVVHFNHKLRGKSSDADEKFVAKLAAKHRLPFHAARADVAAKAKRDKTNLEDTGRRARYEFFAKLVADGHVTRVAVAHTADDQAETVLAHILRGTGLAGFGGIHPVAGHVVRPLMESRRVELRAYLRAKKQSWREDATNRDTARMRARIRRKLMPLLEKHFQPGVVEHLATLAELAREDEAFLEALAGERAAAIVEGEAGTARVSVQDLLTFRRSEGINTEDTKDHRGHKEEEKDNAETRSAQRFAEKNKHEAAALSKRVVRRIVEELKPREGQLNAEHVRSVMELAEHGENGKSVLLPGGIEVRRERDSLLFLPRSSAGSEETVREQPKEFEHDVDLARGQAAVPVPNLGCVFRFRVIDWVAKRGETSDTGAVLDRDALRFPVVLRNWRPGDRLQLPGHRRAHKLKRLLNEKHISRWERNGWPVLTSGGVLAWARGFPVAAEFAASERTRAGMVIVEEKLL